MHKVLEKMKTQVNRYILFSLIVITGVLADVPLKMNYQGKLTDASGIPTEAPVSMTFSLWDAPSGGNKMWEEDFALVDPNHGLFSVILDLSMGWESGYNLDDFDAEDVYINLNVDGCDLSPRELITAMVYALDIRDTVVTTAKIRDAAVVPSKLADGAIAGQVLEWDGAEWQLAPNHINGEVKTSSASYKVFRPFYSW